MPRRQVIKRNYNEIPLDLFMKLKLNWEYHNYHREGSKCIYQDLAKNKRTVGEIIDIIREDPEYLSDEKYLNSPDPKIRSDHMLHYVNCVKFGFRKNLPEWKKDKNNFLLVKTNYEKSEKMSDLEITDFLKNNPITFDKNNILIDGNHRTLTMLGRVLRGENYIPLTTRVRIPVNNSMTETYLPVVGYRTADSKKRLTVILKNVKKSKFSALDIGSNFGYFSSNLAINNKDSIVFSFEGSYGTGNKSNNASKSKGIITHEKMIQRYQINNNFLIPKLFSLEILENLITENIVVDYLLLLSVFHWMVYYKYGNSGTMNQIEEMFVKCLQITDNLFLELPEKGQKTSVSPIYNSYNNIPRFLEHIKQKFFENLIYEKIHTSDWYGKRELYFITCNNKISDLEEIKKFFRSSKSSNFDI